jgi:putative transposase
VLKSFRYRLYPTRAQRSIFRRTLSQCCWLYNYFLEQRRTLWDKNQESIDLYNQQAFLPKIKQESPALKSVYSQVLQNVGTRIDLAFKSFFRRVKRGDKPGYPRFKSWKRYDSFTYPQDLGFRIIKDKAVVQLGKIGRVRMKYHRPIKGKVKTCTIKRTPTDKWFITFSCEIESASLQPNVDAVGIDVGLMTFAAFDDGTLINNPRFFRREEKALARTQRQLSTESKGSPEREKRRRAVALIHERIANKRKDFAHQLSRRIINKYGLVAVEDLNINRMMEKNSEQHKRGMNKSIGDAAWNMFITLLTYKAEEAGRKLVKVNPAYTTQTCSACGYRQAKKLGDRTHKCSCGLTLDRDVNAARNILRLGLQSQVGIAHQEAVRLSVSAE